MKMNVILYCCIFAYLRLCNRITIRFFSLSFFFFSIQTSLILEISNKYNHINAEQVNMVSIDPTDFVEAEEGALSLRFGDEKQQAKFELGVCMAIYKWEELNTAVENSWGGANSADKRDWISGIVIDLFQEKIVDIQLIEETLLYAMVDEFDTEVDNDSALEIGALIFNLYKEVASKNYNTVDAIYNKWQEKQSRSESKSKIVIEEDPNNPDVSEGEDDEESEDEKHYIPQLTQDDGMDVDEEPKGPIVDDDGFELVQKKGRRR